MFIYASIIKADLFQLKGELQLKEKDMLWFGACVSVSVLGCENYIIDKIHNVYICIHN